MDAKYVGMYSLVLICVALGGTLGAGCGGSTVKTDATLEDISQLPPEEMLFAAARRGDLDAVKQVVESNPDAVYLMDNAGKTPLHSAAEGDHLDVVKYLIEMGADTLAEDDAGQDPVAAATEARASAAVINYINSAGSAAAE